MQQDSTANYADEWKALLLCPHRGMLGELMPLLSQELPLLSVFDVNVYPPRRTLQELMGKHACNLCFLDAASDRERALATIAEIRAIEPALQIVVLFADKDPDLLLRCLRQGASEFLMQPFTPEQIHAALDRLSRENPNVRGRVQKGKVYCVMPAKGACGASTVACHLAFQWKRLGSKKTLLADLDPLTGTQAFLLKLKSNYSFIDALTRAGTLDADIWKGLVSQTHGIDVLLSPESLVEGVNELQDAGSIVEYSRRSYDTIVLDSSGAYGEWSLTLARLCDELLLVTTNELPALQAAQRTLAYLDRNRISRSKIRLVINRYNKEVGLNKEMIETALHTEVFQLLPSDYEGIQRALMEGKSAPANSGFGKSLSALADRLAGKDEPPPAAPKKKGGLAGLLSMFSR